MRSFALVLVLTLAGCGAAPVMPSVAPAGVVGAPAFQAACLPLLLAAAEAGEAELAHAAMLTDRVTMGRMEKQVYGTQVMPEGGKWVRYPIEDEAHVDERRAKVGLEPLADYLARFNER